MDKILIIDDVRLHALQLKNILGDTYDVTIAQTVEDGLSYAATGDFSLVLLDVVMPEMDGFTVLIKLQEDPLTQSIPVILITSLSAIEDEQKGLTLGAVDYITKPFHPLIVKARVDTHIKLYNYRRQAEHQSKTDQLTGVANRRQHDHYSSIRWNEAYRLHIPFSVCMFDIDRFKAYNDAFGHPAGDKVITTVAQTISSHMRRNTEFFGRYGGEEFVGFTLGGSLDRTYKHMKRIRQEIEDLHIPHDPSVSEWVTVSIGGVTVIPREKDMYDHYLKIADNMVYEAKHRGRNRVIWTDGKSKIFLE